METGVAYFGERIPRHVASDLADIVEHGCTYVVHTFSEADWKFYERTMTRLVELSHAAGLRVSVSPWGVGHVFGGEAFSEWVAEHPDLCQRDAEGAHLPAACLNQPAFRRFVAEWVGAAAGIGVDTLFWDEPHLFVGAWRGEPSRWSCRCAVCRDLYRSAHGEDMPSAREDAGVRAFRAATVLDFLGAAVTAARGRGLRSAVCLYPEEVLPDAGPCWSDVAALPGLASLGTDPYPFSDSFDGREPWPEYVGRNARKVSELARRHGIDSHLWIQAFKIPAGREGYVEEAARLAAASGIRDLAAWGFDGCAHISSIACDRPDVVWKAIGRAFRGVREERP